MANPASSDQPAGPSRRLRVSVAAFVLVLLLAAIAAIMWRGPAILLDLSGYAQALWCF